MAWCAGPLPLRWRGGGWCLFISTIFLVGCAGKPPLAAPAVQVTASHYLGTPLSGSARQVPTTQPIDSTSARLLEVELFGLEAMPTSGAAFGELRSVGADARLVTAMRDNQPVLATGRLTAGARWAHGEPAEKFLAAMRQSALGRFVPLQGTQTLVAISGVTARAMILDPSSTTSIGQTRRIAFYAHELAGKESSDSSLELGLAAFNLDDVAAEAGISSELISLAPIRFADLNPVVIVAPFALDGGRWSAVVAQIRQLEQPDADRLAKAIEQSRLDIAREAELIAAAQAAAALAVTDVPTVQTALSATTDPAARRRAMVFLADLGGAAACADVCLVADDAFLAQLADDARKQFPSLATMPTTMPASAGSARIGWLLEQTCLKLMTSAVADGKLSAELMSVLINHTGEAGRHANSMDQVLHGSANIDQLRTRLIAENFIYLEDSSAASRVRAYDWLVARGKAPAGFDPLAPVRERRQALDAALAEAAGASK